MDKTKLTNILSMQDDILSMQELVLVQRLAEKYPFCSLFWVLGAKISTILNSFNQKEWLSKAGVFVADRERLKQTILSAKETLERRKELQNAMLKKANSKDIITEINSYKEENLSENPTKEELINRFLKIENPKLSPKEAEIEETEENIDNVIKRSAKEDISFATETMAKIYLKQGNKDKAIKIYQQLMTSNPKKSIYFANQIEKIKNS
ncbi:MAG: tetratricopeptide repeat protein [Bacteroidota bacterium]|nr:tetratricopeptide repeat protein [Bacteroidota bacterium]